VARIAELLRSPRRHIRVTELCWGRIVKKGMFLNVCRRQAESGMIGCQMAAGSRRAIQRREMCVDQRLWAIIIECQMAVWLNIVPCCYMYGNKNIVSGCFYMTLSFPITLTSSLSHTSSSSHSSPLSPFVTHFIGCQMASSFGGTTQRLELFVDWRLWARMMEEADNVMTSEVGSDQTRSFSYGGTRPCSTQNAMTATLKSTRGRCSQCRVARASETWS